MTLQEKQALRACIKEKRRSVPEKDPFPIVARILCSPLFLDADILFLYAGATGEVDVFPIAEKAWEMGKLVAFPLTCGKGVMTFHKVTSLAELSCGFHGILEPPKEAPVLTGTKKSLMLVPALAFDVKGYRLGYGGGYYDRYLPSFKGTTLGVAFQEYLLPKLPHESHDMRVSYMVTDEKMIQTRMFYGTGF